MERRRVPLKTSTGAGRYRPESPAADPGYRPDLGIRDPRYRPDLRRYRLELGIGDSGYRPDLQRYRPELESETLDIDRTSGDIDWTWESETLDIDRTSPLSRDTIFW